MEMETFYVCKCYYTDNYYIPQIKLHVTYKGDKVEFLQKFEKLLRSSGYNENNWNEILELLDREFSRRKILGHRTVESIKIIKLKYKPLHKDVYIFKEEHFQASFLKMANYCKLSSANVDNVTKMMNKLKPDRCYNFPIFTKKFCIKFTEEMEHFEKSDCPKNRPNTMNRKGLLMNEIGMNQFLDKLRIEYLNPIAKILYPEWVGNSLDSHKSFTVKYSKEQDLDLSEHYDNAEVTINVSLGDDFEDSSLYFKSMRQEPVSNPIEVKHTLGYAIIHRGQHIHGAMPISDGQRCNLIMWMRSSSIRNKLCPMCDKAPTLVPQIGCGDGFTMMEMCNLV